MFFFKKLGSKLSSRWIQFKGFPVRTFFPLFKVFKLARIMFSRSGGIGRPLHNPLPRGIVRRSSLFILGAHIP